MRKLCSFIFCIFLIISVSTLCYAHPGRTDKNGGHYNHSTGEYHYHNDGENLSNKKEIYIDYIEAKVWPEIIHVEDNIRFDITIGPANSNAQRIYYYSSNPSVVKVDEVWGEAYAVGAGETIITLKAIGGYYIEIPLTVYEVEGKGIKITGDAGDEIVKNGVLTCYQGDYIHLSLDFIPENTTDRHSQEVDWIIEDENIISHWKNERRGGDHSQIHDLEAKNVGETILTAKTDKFEDSIKVIVKPILAESIYIDSDAVGFLSYKKGSEIILETYISPKNTTDKTVIWSVENEKIATVDENGVLRCLRKGETTLTAETVNGVSDSITLKVYRFSFFEKLKITFFSIILVLILCFINRVRKEYKRM